MWSGAWKMHSQVQDCPQAGLSSRKSPDATRSESNQNIKGQATLLRSQMRAARKQRNQGCLGPRKTAARFLCTPSDNTPCHVLKIWASTTSAPRSASRILVDHLFSFGSTVRHHTSSTIDEPESTFYEAKDLIKFYLCALYVSWKH